MPVASGVVGVTTGGVVGAGGTVSPFVAVVGRAVVSVVTSVTWMGDFGDSGFAGTGGGGVTTGTAVVVAGGRAAFLIRPNVSAFACTSSGLVTSWTEVSVSRKTTS